MALQITVTRCWQLRWTSVGPWVFCYCSVITTDIDRLFLEIFRTMWHCCDTQTPDQGLTSLVWIDKVLLNLCGVLHVVWAAYFSRTTHFFNALLRNDWQVESCKYLIIQLSEVGVTVYLWDNYQIKAIGISISSQCFLLPPLLLSLLLCVHGTNT